MQLPPSLPLPPAPIALAHHSEPSDPALLDWIRHTIDSITGLGPFAFVVLLGCAVLAIPAAILIAFMMNRAKPGA